MPDAMPNRQDRSPPCPSVLARAHEVALACADAVRPIARRYFRKPLEARAKEDASPVTIADREAEVAMRAIIEQAFPDHGILGEEYGTAPGREVTWQWVLDPIDGTRAFITGRPSFGTLIGLLHDGHPVLGVLEQPITGERWIGVEGADTVFISSLGGEIGTRALPDLAQAELSCTSPDIFTTLARPRFDALAGRVRRVSWGGDCYAYGLLALGQIDAIAECTMNIWDWAALVPIVTGAGGSMTDWQGEKLHAGSDGTVLALGDPARLRDAVAALSSATGAG